MLVSHDSLVYVGDGSSDVHVMLHVNRLDGLTIAVSENKYITQIARRTILSDNALSILVPMLEYIMGWDSIRIRALFHAHGFVLQEWDKVRTDLLTIAEAAPATSLAVVYVCRIPTYSDGSPRLFSPAPICSRSSRTLSGNTGRCGIDLDCVRVHAARNSRDRGECNRSAGRYRVS